MGTDPGRIRDYAQAVEELGYDFLTAGRTAAVWLGHIKV